ncbi:hypothetical protein MELE44368_16865 [Mycolicibacterium elephantis DSM 44368]|uniref:Uncharacterized protein n=1 Tax=Mycolicibacterium elephantis DSM 44368 TaxID=1335622 RepID=A0A439DW83_9MYCO|nr:hypothetical protein MELE44368_16865 [Mycolicibacterium elephantis DSM 44368]
MPYCDDNVANSSPETTQLVNAHTMNAVANGNSTMITLSMALLTRCDRRAARKATAPTSRAAPHAAGTAS